MHQEDTRSKTKKLRGPSCKTAAVLRDFGVVDLMLGSVSPFHWESFMSYEILHEDKTNVGERLFYLKNNGRGNGGMGACPRKKFLEGHTP